jgi:6-phosphogluconate dehydrogenase
MDLQLPIPTIDAAVAMRDLSVYRDERRMAEEIYGGELDAASRVALTHPKASTHHLERALYAAFLITYAQGFALLRKASLAYGYGLDLAVIACIWRGGCIIRAALLEDIRAAYRLQPDLPNLLLAPDIVPRITDRIIDFRLVVQLAVGAAIPIPALTASLGYLDGYRSGWLPANLIQAQRDFFGAHTYERLDTRGTFHTHWSAAEGVE